MHPASCTCMNCMRKLKTNDPDRYQEAVKELKKTTPEKYHHSLGLDE